MLAGSATEDLTNASGSPSQIGIVEHDQLGILADMDV